MKFYALCNQLLTLTAVMFYKDKNKSLAFYNLKIVSRKNMLEYLLFKQSII